jgi:hypothetical protein
MPTETLQQQALRTEGASSAGLATPPAMRPGKVPPLLTIGPDTPLPDPAKKGAVLPRGIPPNRLGTLNEDGPGHGARFAADVDVLMEKVGIGLLPEEKKVLATIMRTLKKFDEHLARTDQLLNRQAMDRADAAYLADPSDANLAAILAFPVKTQPMCERLALANAVVYNGRQKWVGKYYPLLAAFFDRLAAALGDVLAKLEATERQLAAEHGVSGWAPSSTHQAVNAVKGDVSRRGELVRQDPSCGFTPLARIFGGLIEL